MSSCHSSAFWERESPQFLGLPAEDTELGGVSLLLGRICSTPRLPTVWQRSLGSGAPPCLLALPSVLSFPTCTVGSHKSEMMLTGLTLTVMSLLSSCTFQSSLGPHSCPLVGAFSLVWCFKFSAVIYCL